MFVNIIYDYCLIIIIKVVTNTNIYTYCEQYLEFAVSIYIYGFLEKISHKFPQLFFTGVVTHACNYISLYAYIIIVKCD